ncbi:hypothetical protein A7D21_28470 [Pseudomonas sp. AP19]|uniref:hypothetical protein n=1 Tax=Pseudomonas TaxID=286 RepID=UPI00084A46D9|nr:hypothetical protein [Pseudomonas sp. AP19]OEC63818.1 hypothetical protein A7D21_28470 [Pseudomonas sp. AP19]
MHHLRFSSPAVRRFGFTLASAFGATIIAGCAASQGGDESSAYDSAMAQQSIAIRSVQVYKAVPERAIGVRSVMAAACGSDASDFGPDENYILTGLKIKAYKSGANGLALVDIQRMPAPKGDCDVGFSVGGTAKAFTVQQ